jgi:hypothetical protein
MIDQVDQFVFLDSVQFAKRSWQQRNKIKTANGELMISVPVLSKGVVDQLILNTKILNDGSFSKKLISTLMNNYSKAPFFKKYSEGLFKIIEENSENLCDLNIEIIKYCMLVLGLPVDKLLRSSSLDVSGKKAELLANICVKLDSNVYLSAPGSREYIEETTEFEERKIEVIYHNYNHPQYSQLYGDFIPYLCILDLIFNEGENSLSIIRQGILHTAV